MRKVITVEKFKETYKLKNKKDVLDESTYVRATVKARFIDPVHGEYWTTPTRALHTNVGHPATRGIRSVITRIEKFGTNKLGGRKKERKENETTNSTCNN